MLVTQTIWNIACLTAFLCAGCAKNETCGGSRRTSVNGTCVDLMTNHEHCGAADNACASGNVCYLGTCIASTCRPPLLRCGDTCIDPATDSGYCGARNQCVGEDRGEICSIDVNDVDSTWLANEADLEGICACMCGNTGCGMPL